MIIASPDLARVLALPERDPPTPDARPLPPSRRPCRCADLGRECPTMLTGTQVAALEELRAGSSQGRGLFAAMAPGSGKTALGLLGPVVTGLFPAVLLLPSRDVDQVLAEREWWGGHLRVPFIRTVRSDAETATVAFDPSVLWLVPYEILARPAATDLLDRLAPRLLMADESHRLRRRGQSVTVRRVLGRIAKAPETVFASWTGTPTAKSVADFSHLLAFALRRGSPLPLDVAVVQQWAECFDHDPHTGAGRDLVGEFASYLRPGEEPRDGLRRRMYRTAGVVGSPDGSLDLLPPLSLKVLHVPLEARPALALARLDKEWCLPSGEELTLATEVWQARTELLCGFHYRWHWDDPPSAELLRRWLDARAAWHRELRGRLQHRSRPGLDSEALVEAAMLAGTIPSSDRFEAWREVRDLVPTPETVPVWLDDSWMAEVVALARRERALVWFTHRAVGERLADHLPVFHEGDGVVPALRKMGAPPAALSIRSCGQGVDGLQRLYSVAVTACPYQSGEGWEQKLARLHRRGQDREVAHWVVARDAEYLARAAGECRYQRQMVGFEQRLLAARGLAEALACAEREAA